jgi:hypothetical protein
MLARARYRAAAIEATLVWGSHLRLTTDRAVVVPITGAYVEPDAELYGGQAISSVAVLPESAQSIPLEALVGYQPVAAVTSPPLPSGAHE